MKRAAALAGASVLVLLWGCGSGPVVKSLGQAPPATSVDSPAGMSLSVTAFDFGDNLVGNADTQTVVTVTNTGGSPLTLAPAVTGDGSFQLNAAGSCGTELPAASSCVEIVTYTPAAAVAQETATLNLNPANLASGTASSVTLTGSAALLTSGIVSSTNNPQVALYTITPPFAGNVTVNFGRNTSYGFRTWAVPADGVHPVKIYVAGMLQNTAYHMQASVTLTNGVTATDVDHTFTTGSYPANVLPHISAMTTPGQTPQPGIEMMDQLYAGGSSNALSAYVTDLSGNLIWAYNIPDADSQTTVQGFKLMPNGDIALVLSPVTTTSGPVPPGVLSVLREIDLAGDTVQQVTLEQLNQRLTNAGFDLTLADIHHDVTILPNGHFLLVASLFKVVDSVAGYSGPQNVLGDAIIDLDPNMNPVWVWNEFDHLDVNRHPYMFPDWTHTNAVVYSPTDGNILVSMRHQNWVVKVNYENGTGDGSVLWRLGEGGDFTLENGVDPTDWPYAQHAPAIVGDKSAGTFELTLMDNGDDRMFPAGVNCGTGGSAPPCLYTTVPIFQIDESAKTADLVFHQIIPPAQYSLWGGNANVLANGNVEYDLCSQTGPASEVYEVTNGSSPQVVWNLVETGANLYRSTRVPSLYPGVQWSGTGF